MKTVSELKILGLLITNYLSITSHVDDIISNCASSMYALRILRASGLQENALFRPTVCNTTTTPTCICLPGHGFFLRKLHRTGYSHKVNTDDQLRPEEKKLSLPTLQIKTMNAMSCVSYSRL